jgi:hypothetical protein
MPLVRNSPDVLAGMWLVSTTGVVGPGRWKLVDGVGMALLAEPMDPSAFGVLLIEPGMVCPGAGDGGRECAVDA